MKQAIIYCAIVAIQCSGILTATLPNGVNYTTAQATTIWPSPIPSATDGLPVSHPPSGCSLSVLASCLNPLTGTAAILPWQRGAVGTVDLSSACRIFQGTRQCYETATASCNPTDTLASDLLVAMYEYVCTPAGLKNFETLSQCFSNQEALKAMSNCSDLSGIELTACSVPNHFISCSTNVGKTHCSQEASTAITEIVRSSFSPYEKAFNCDLSSILGDDGKGVNSTTAQPTTIWPTPIPSATDGLPECSLSVLASCLNPLNEPSAAILPWQSGAADGVDLSTACRIFQGTRQCYKRETSSCKPTDTLSSDLLVAMYEYVCTPEGSKNFKTLSQCFTNQETVTAMASCATLQRTELTGCGIPNHVIPCAKDVGKKYCSKEASTAITEIMKSSFTPFVNAYNCDLSSILGDAGGDDGEGNTAAISSLHATLLMLTMTMYLL